MAEDISNIIGKLQQTLSEAGGAEKLQEMLGAMMNNNQSGAGNSQQPPDLDDGYTPPAPTPTVPPNNVPNNALGDLNPESIMKIKRIYDKMNRNDDPRVHLLAALKPYMSPRRASHVDNAVQILSLTKLGDIMKDL